MSQHGVVLPLARLEDQESGVSKERLASRAGHVNEALALPLSQTLEVFVFPLCPHP